MPEAFEVGKVSRILLLHVSSLSCSPSSTSSFSLLFLFVGRTATVARAPVKNIAVKIKSKVRKNSWNLLVVLEVVIFKKKIRSIDADYKVRKGGKETWVRPDWEHRGRVNSRCARTLRMKQTTSINSFELHDSQSPILKFCFKLTPPGIKPLLQTCLLTARFNTFSSPCLFFVVFHIPSFSNAINCLPHLCSSKIHKIL